MSTRTAASPRGTTSTSRPILDSVDATHREILGALTQLEQLVTHLSEHGSDSVAQQSAAQVCRFFSTVARQHHLEEERQIFPPLLVRADAELAQQIQRLQQDHGWLEEDWIELSPLLQAVAEGQNVYEVETLRQGVNVFVNLYHEHIALEDSMIFPAARRQSQA
ncbi:MAG: hemerythrin domain-containing protein [Burkholderiaceae bacterium]